MCVSRMYTFHKVEIFLVLGLIWLMSVNAIFGSIFAIFSAILKKKGSSRDANAILGSFLNEENLVLTV